MKGMSEGGRKFEHLETLVSQLKPSADVSKNADNWYLLSLIIQEAKELQAKLQKEM